MIPIEVIEKLAKLFEVDVCDLLDEYNLFLYHGQGRYIKKLRKDLCFTQKQLAQRTNVCVTKVKCWEEEKVRMTKTTWEKLKAVESNIK